jgi:hypothetical protein
VAKDMIFKVLMPSAVQMFLVPSLIAMSIAATRMYRSLADFVYYKDVCGTVSFHYLRN